MVSVEQTAYLHFVAAEQVVWSAVDADCPTCPQRHSYFDDPALPPPLVCRVAAGEVLYLPAGWWHQVQQLSEGEEPVVAINYWYDMAFDVKSAMVTLVTEMARHAGLSEGPDPRIECQ